MAQETLQQAFPDKATPLVSSGISYTDACVKHVNETFKASRVFIIASATLTKNTTHTDDLKKALGSKVAGIRIGMTSHTLMSEILEIVEDCKKVSADCIVTLGGGSISDGAKTISFALANNVSTLEQLQSLPHIGPNTENLPAKPSQIPIICIPTTLSAGEYTSYAGVTNHLTHRKIQLSHPLQSPSLIILSGALAVSTPLETWLQSGMRSLDHCIETLCSLSSTEEVDASVLKALKCLVPGLLKTKTTPEDEQARFDCQAGTMYAIIFVHRKVWCGASHGIGHMLGPLGKVAHGETSAILLPAVCKYNAKHGGADVLAGQREIVDTLWGIQVAKERQAGLGDLVAAIVKELGLKASLGEAGVGRDKWDTLAQNSMRDWLLETNPVPISKPEQVLEILEGCA